MGYNSTTKDFKIKKRGKRMEDTEISRILDIKIARSLNGDEGDISKRRTEILKAYRGDKYGNEREGHSSYPTREVYETVEWILPDVLEVFSSNERPVEYLPVGPEDVEQAKQESDLVLYELTQHNNSFLTMHDWFKEALLYPNSYAKIFMEELTTRRVKEYKGLDQLQLVDLVEQEGVELIEHDVRQEVEVIPPQVPGQPPQEMLVDVFDVKVECIGKEKKLKFIPWPPEHILIDSNHMGLELDDAEFVCGRSKKTKTKLLQEGIDEDVLDETGSYEDHSWSEEEINRYQYEDEQRGRQAENEDPARQEYWDNDCYIYLDVDGDGYAELRNIRMIGSTIISNKEVDYQPFVAAASVRIPHRHVGMSIAESVEYEQKVNTALMRQLLDNIYALNRHRKFVWERGLGPRGIAAMQNARSSLVPTKLPPRESIMEDTTPNMIGDILPILDAQKMQLRLRSGMTPDTSLDPSTLQRVAAEPFMEAQQQKNKRTKMLVRILAETAMKPLMKKARLVLQANQNKPLTRQLRGKWVTTKPSEWPDRTDLRVNVGLGKQEKERKTQMLFGLLQKQMEVMPMGLVTPKEIYATLEQVVGILDIGDVSHFLIDPESPTYQPPQPPPPSPVEQAQVGVFNAQAMELQAKAQALLPEIELKRAAEGAKAEQARAKANAEQQKMQLEAQKQALESNIAMREMALKEFETRKRYDLSRDEAAAKIDNVDEDTRLKIAQQKKTAAEAFKARKDAVRPQPSTQTKPKPK